MREDIEKYLGTVQQSTAKTIAERIGIDRVDAARELNHMLADGIVEREKREGGGNEYVYWLARGDVKDAAITAGAERSQSEPESAAPTITKPEAFDAPEFREVDRPLVALCEFLDISILNTETPVKDVLAVLKMRQESVARLQDEHARILMANEKLRENNAALEKRIDELTLGPVGAKSPLFVTVGRHAAPKRHASLDKAQKRAASLVRNEKELEVLVLEPVGRVVRGSEWRPL